MAPKKNISIIGGGSAGLFLACLLDPSKFSVRVFERNAAPARKFLVAGAGGLNLTHSEAPEKFVQRYTPGDFLKRHFLKHDNREFVNWLSSLGIVTYTGSSGRIFPAGKIKPAQVLDLMMQKALANGVQFYFGYEWMDFSASGMLMMKSKQPETIHADIFVFCLGGASWPVTGSSGTWLKTFAKAGLTVKDFEASNCSFVTDWPKELCSTLQGKPLKNILLSCDGISRQGEITITANGLEGSGIYPFSPLIRRQIKEAGSAMVFIDLKPAIAEKDLLSRLRARPAQVALTDLLRKTCGLTGTQLRLLKGLLNREDFLKAEILASFVKRLPARIIATGPVDEAISTAGGLCLGEVDANFELRKMPGIYVIGEMLDYDAPTGGYLLQSCYSMAASLAAHLCEKNA